MPEDRAKGPEGTVPWSAAPLGPVRAVHASEAIGYGWRALLRSPAALLLHGLLLVTTLLLVQVAAQYVPAGSLRALWNLLAQVPLLIVGAGIVRAAFAVVDGERPRLRHLWRGPGTPTFVVAGMIISLLVGVGLALFVVPGLVLLFLFQFSGLAAVDDPGTGPFQVIGRSVSLAASHGPPVLLLDAVVVLAVALVFAASFVGPVGLLLAFLLPAAAVPLLTVAAAVLYRRITGRYVAELS